MSRRARPCPRGDGGSASVLVVAVAAAVLVAAAAAGALAGAVSGRHAAAAAADLGALAGAAVVVAEPHRACPRAAEVVRRNGATVVACRLDGWTFEAVAGAPSASAVRWLRLPDPVRLARAAPGSPGRASSLTAAVPSGDPS